MKKLPEKTMKELQQDVHAYISQFK
ncbi:MAG: nucleotide pyrophosphohydrolase, partial [Bacillaceae bacterium]|nr:nucleotide pyrophosphohydrolase [Bacillaceae bacterium]